MTTFDRFDPFERRIGEALDGLAPLRRPDYLDDILRQTARTRQRPRWTFLERWLPVDTTLPRPMLFGRIPIRQLFVLALLVAFVAAGLVFYIGTQNRVPPPFGLADNGQIVFGMDGDLYVKESLSSAPRLLIKAEGTQGGVVHSPDGRLFAYDSVVSGADRVWVADANGSNPRQVLERAFTGQSFAWAPDSKAMAIVTHATRPELWIAPADGSGARLVELEGLYPWEATWDPQRPGVLLVKAEGIASKEIDLFFVDLNGAVLSKFDLQGEMLNGASWEFSGVAMSPDGGTIAFNSVEAVEPPVNRFRVHLIDRDGTNRRAIPAPYETLYSQAWTVYSPDGTWIAMEAWKNQPDGPAVNQVAIAPADGSAPARLIGPAAPGQTIIKTWSPDGTRLLVCLRDVGEVYTVDPVTGTFERIPGLTELPDWQRVAR